MASSILKTLQDIEAGRQGIISTVSGKNIPVSRDASLSSIDDFLKVYMSDVTGNDNLIYHADGDYITPENDPTLWSRPDTWLDLKSIYHELETYTISGSGLVCHPICVLELDDTKSSTIFSANRGGSDETDNLISISIGNSGYLTSQNLQLVYKTSDGAEYIFNKDNLTDVEHTWDSSKDIISGEDHFRLVYVYYHRTNITTQKNYMFHDINLRKSGVIDMAMLPISSNIPIWQSVKQKSIIFVGGYNILNSQTQCYLHGAYVCDGICLFEVEPIDDTFYIYLGSYDRYYSKIGVGASLISNNRFQPDAVLSKEFKYIYLYDTIGILPLTDYNTNNDGASTSNIISNNLTYFIVNKCNTASVTPCHYPVNTNIFDKIKKLTTLDYISGYKNICLPLCTEITCNTIRDIQCNLLYFPEVAGNFPPLYYSQNTPLYIVAPKATHINSSNNFYANGNGSSLYLDFRSSTNMILLNSGSATYINMSSAETCNITFLNYTKLKTLILKDGFKFSLDFSKNPVISRESLLDIINKCATLEEGEIYTINLGGNSAKLTPEEIAVATNKGWTIS